MVDGYSLFKMRQTAGPGPKRANIKDEGDRNG